MRTSCITLCLLAVLSACQSKKNLPTPNIVWITSEDNSKHYMELFDPNGVATPNIARIATRGVRFNRAFSNAPVCSVARSTLITGCYAPRIGAQFHRKIESVPMPEGVEMFPAYLRSAGYYTSNNSKEDYNLIKSDSVWDDSSRSASWRNREADQPFFHVQNFGTTHESRLHFTKEAMDTVLTKNDPGDMFVMPVHPQTDLLRYTNAWYRDKIQEMDKQVGEVLDQLEADGLLDQTIVFYFGDHGGVLPGSKGYLYETGLHIPLVISVPEKYQEWLGVERGGASERFVSFVDFGPTVLHLAGIEVPTGMDGRPFVGADLDWEEVNARDVAFSYADRFDEKYDLVRAVRKGQFKYIRSFQPFNVDGLMNNYRYRQLAYQEWSTGFQAGDLDETQAAFFRSRPTELLFDLASDPYETRNLSDHMEYKERLMTMRSLLEQQMQEGRDLSLLPEHYLIETAWQNPVYFGESHGRQLNEYLQIANMALQPFGEVQEELTLALDSDDPWKKYWAINACITFAEEANQISSLLRVIQLDDPALLNRSLAALYFAIVDRTDPVPTLLEALYQSAAPAEALAILNMLVLTQDYHGFEVVLDLSQLDDAVSSNSEVKRRLLYLGHESSAS